MKVLYYFPDFFFRNSYTEYRWLVETVFLHLRNTDYTESLSEFKFFIHCSRFLADIISEKHGDPSKLLTHSSIATLDSFHRIESGDNDHLHKSLRITKWSGGSSNRRLSFIQEQTLSLIYQRFKFDVAITWGNNTHLKDWCSKRQVETIFAEMGYTREPTVELLILDQNGVNSHSSIAVAPESSFTISKSSFIDTDFVSECIFENHVGIIADQEKTRGIFNGPNRLRCSISQSSLSRDISKSIKSSHPRFDTSDHNTLRLEKTERNFTATVFLQLCDDSQVILGSVFTSMAEYARFIIPEIMNIYGNNVNILIKLHPAATASCSPRAANYSDTLHLTSILKDEEFVSITNAEWQDLAACSHAVFGINSSVLFESWLFNPNLDVYISGVPGWYPSSSITKKNGFSSGAWIHKCDSNILCNVAFITFSGYGYRWEKDGKSLVNATLHKLTSFTTREADLDIPLPMISAQDNLKRATPCSRDYLDFISFSLFKPSTDINKLRRHLDFLCSQTSYRAVNLYLLKSVSTTDSANFPCRINVIKTSSNVVVFEVQVTHTSIPAKLKYKLYFLSPNGLLICKRDLSINPELTCSTLTIPKGDWFNITQTNMVYILSLDISGSPHPSVIINEVAINNTSRN